TAAAMIRCLRLSKSTPPRSHATTARISALTTHESSSCPRRSTCATIHSQAMPIYEFVCMQCESHFEELVAMGASADCPDCGSANVRKQLSVFAAHGVEGGSA